VKRPVEYILLKITQTQVHEVPDDIAAGLRAILRQDPDIIIGEMEDPETAETAVRAVLTDEVFTTLHTNDVGAIPA